MVMTEPATLPEGQDSFKLNEVCKLAGVQPYMLRFWGTEFPQVEAQRTGTGQRVYSREQVETILEVKRLLFDEGLTVAGAKRRLQAEQKESEAEVEAEVKKRPRPLKRPEPKGLQPVDEAPVMPTVPAQPEPTVSAVEVIAAADQAPMTPTVQKAPDPAVEAVDLAAEVDKAASERVQPLLATLREVREELEQLAAALEGTKQ
jgi:DNA-binding transcriptional MerR regulator